MANVKLILVFSVVIATGLSLGFELGKNQKEKSAPEKSKTAIAKSAKRFKELKRQNNRLPTIHDGFEFGKNHKEKSALKKLEAMIVEAKSAKQFKKHRRQNLLWIGIYSIPPGIHNGDDTDDDMARSARDIPPYNPPRHQPVA